MRKFRFLFSALAISVSVLVVEPFSNEDDAFAQSVEEATRLNQKAVQLIEQGRYADAEPQSSRLGLSIGSCATRIDPSGGRGMALMIGPHRVVHWQC